MPAMTLRNLHTNLGLTNACAFLIEDNSKGNVNITLVGENFLLSGVYSAGLQKNGIGGEDVGMLTICGYGNLTAYSHNEIGAGIGGCGGWCFAYLEETLLSSFTAPPEVRSCPKCGKPIEPGARFCGGCGEKLC